MAEPIAPWLQFSPQTFASAAEAGQRLGQGQQQINLERDRLAQSAAQAAAQLGMEGARLDAASKQAAQEHQLQTDHLQQNFLRDQTNADITRAYHDATIGLGKQKLDEVAQTHAQQIADRQGYAMAVSGGMTPAEALTKYPGAWTQGTTDFLARSSSKADPYQLANYKTLQAAYLAATKEYEKDPSPAKARIALNYRNQVQDATRNASGTIAGTPASGTAGSAGILPAAPPSAPSPNGTPAQTAPPPVNEVIRLTKDGKRAVFNADTKAFLRYAD